MTENEYCDLSDLQHLRIVSDILRKLYLLDHGGADKGKIKGCVYNLILSLEEKVSKHVDKE